MNPHPQTGYTHVMHALHAVAGFIGVTSGAMLAGIWILYRVVRGWMSLRDGKAMYG